MTRLRVYWSRALDVLLRRGRDRRLADEVRAHLDLLTEEHLARGLAPDDARLAARRAFGGVDQMTLAYRDQRGLPFLDALTQDLRFASRLLRRDPRFGLITIGSLALSIGAITFVFSAVNAVVLRPLPVADPGSVYALQSGVFSFSYPDYRDSLGGPARAIAWGVMGLGGLLLLAGCFNLAGLLLARGADRGAEIALRSAVGAGRGRIVRQLVTEAALLALAGGSLGALLAWWATTAVSGRPLPVELPVAFDVAPDAGVFAFAFALSAMVGALVAIAPARYAARLDVTSALRRIDAPALTGRRWAVRDVFACAQVALCVVLLHTCLLAIGGLRRASTASIGWNPDGIAIAGADLGLAGYDNARARQFQQRLLDEIRRIPGVTAAATGNELPLGIDQSTNTVFSDGTEQTATGSNAATYQVSPGYFGTLGIARLSGRDFTGFDRQDTPQVAIVNRALAERLFGTSEAVGRHVRFGRGGKPIEVVGIVEDGKYRALSEDRRPAIFMPHTQWFNYSTMAIVRSNRPEAQVSEELRGVLLRMDPALPLRAVATGAGIVALPLLPYRVAAAALGVLSLIAGGLMLTGVHALMAYLVVRRKRDIAVRVALGGSRSQVVRAVLAHVTTVLGVGAAAGFAAAMVSGSVLSSVALGVSPRDPVLLVLLVIGVLTIAVASCWGPVRRSLRLDPVAVLREA